MSKGSIQRPAQVTEKEVKDNWERTFAKKDEVVSSKKYVTIKQ